MKPPLYHRYDPVTQRATEITTDPETGNLIFVHSQNTAPIVESAKRLASNFDKHAKRPDGFVHVARLPGVIVQMLIREGIWNDTQALNAWLDRRENRVFRVDDGRKL
jgi:hypothetical protein